MGRPCRCTNRGTTQIACRVFSLPRRRPLERPVTRATRSGLGRHGAVPPLCLKVTAAGSLYRVSTLPGFLEKASARSTPSHCISIPFSLVHNALLVKPPRRFLYAPVERTFFFRCRQPFFTLTRSSKMLPMTPHAIPRTAKIQGKAARSCSSRSGKMSFIWEGTMQKARKAK